MNLRRIKNQVLPLAGGVLLVTALASAQSDRKGYSGLNCVEQTSGTTVVRYGTAFAFQTSGSGKNLVCPAVQDHVGDVNSWRLTVNRNGATAAWTVSLVAANTAGDTGNVNIISVPAGNGIKNINSVGGVARFDDVGQLIVFSSNQPSNARLHEYHIEEEEDGDTF